MMSHAPIPFKVGLFALSGMGNAVLRALCANNLAPSIVVTRDESGPFPYYREQNLAQETRALGIPCLYSAQGEEVASQLNLDVLIVATYHRIIPNEAIQSVGTAVNIHPSLLPAYPGPNPFYSVLIHAEKKTGVTIHALTSDVDGGDIYWQHAIDIHPQETQGSLRHRLAGLAATGVTQFTQELREGCAQSHSQKDQPARHWSERPDISHRRIDPTADPETIATQVRALSPFPGALAEGIPVVEVSSINPTPISKLNPGQIIRKDNNFLVLQTSKAEITFLCAQTTKDIRS